MVQNRSRSSFNCFLKACSSCLAASLWLRNLATRLTWPSTIMAGALGGIVCKGCVASRFELLGFARTICFVSVVCKAKEQTLRTTVHYVGVVLTCSWHARVALHCNVFTCKARSATASPQPFPPDPPFFVTKAVGAPSPEFYAGGRPGPSGGCSHVASMLCIVPGFASGTK